MGFPQKTQGLSRAKGPDRAQRRCHIVGRCASKMELEKEMVLKEWPLGALCSNPPFNVLFSICWGRDIPC